MVRAVWNDIVLAESDHTVVVEGNHYFPRKALRDEHFRASEQTSTCPWKGQARYLDVIVDGDMNPAAGWYYPTPLEAASEIRDHVAFWRGVRVEGE